MKKILVFGAGRSAFYTIQYLLEHGDSKCWKVTIADTLLSNLVLCTSGYPDADTRIADVHNEAERHGLVQEHDIIISLLPARFHLLVAEDCLNFRKHLITPSYVSPEIQAMDERAKKYGLSFINELGLDPGIDHMSAMKVIHSLQAKGAQIYSFKSFCGGLIAPEADDNPWHYKFSWNPYNVIRAGMDGAICKMDGQLSLTPYHRLFENKLEVDIEDSDFFEAYLNRNSLPYMELYNLKEADTFLRGTLRYPDFCPLWNFFVNAGMTQDRQAFEEDTVISWEDYLKIFLPKADSLDLSLIFFDFDPDRKMVASALKWIGSQKPEIRLKGTPAEILQRVLESLWEMKPHDRDRVVMVHEFEYILDGKKYSLQSWLDMEGEDSVRTAMAKTVGLPLALAAQLLCEDKIKAKGVILPTLAEVYEPLLEELEKFKICFKENVKGMKNE